MTLVFVYGTLKRGFGNHGVMQAAGGQFIGNAQRACAKLVHLGGFPGLVETNDPSDVVHGEVYRVSNLAPLDMLEGYDRKRDDGMYISRSRWVEQPDGEGWMVELYVWNSPVDSESDRFIEGGDYVG